MKKITFNALLNHKAHNYKPMQIEVEKVIPLYGKRFEQMRDHPLDDCPEIIENRELMYMEGNTAHCILFLDANGNDGILVEAEGSDYARKSEFISNARAIIEQSEFTYGERQLHAELKAMANRIAELAHTGQKQFAFEEMLGDGNMKAMMIQAVAEMLDRREDLAEVRDHYLGIAGQADFTVTAKPTQEMKLYCPLEIQAEPQIYETDWDRDGVIRVKSEGYDAFTVKLDDLSVQSGQKGTAAIICGIAAKFSGLGAEIGGFDLYCTSDVLSGSGISSSAAFETLIGTLIDSYYNESKAGAVEIAKIGQFAENVYFGKKSGLMDQMVSSVGGLVSIDFYDTQNPEIERFDFDFEEHGCCLCITDTKGSHANLTDDYVAIRSEKESIAAQLGKPHLREVSEIAFYDAIPKLRETCSDRAILRASHFFSENSRALQEADALKSGNLNEFLRHVNESGDSSAQLLQNLYSTSQSTQQEIPLAIMMSKRLLAGTGAVRVHGGGFAGTIQAFVPLELADAYTSEMNRIFGENACQKLRIRPVGGVEITKEEA